MKKFIITSVFFFTLYNVNSQTNLYDLKTSYEKIHSHYVPDVPNYNDHAFTGNSLSWTLSSLIRMYEATGDKAYLIKFINHVIQIQNYRQDRLHPGDLAYPPKWTLDTDVDCGSVGGVGGIECTYYNNLLLYPMSEFVYYVINHPDLYNSNIPDILIDDEHMSPSTTILGYGDFALWLGARVEETILYMNIGYWNDDIGIKKTDNSEDNLAADMNMQSPFASSLLFMGLTYTNFGYGDNHSLYLYHAQLIANKYKSTINIDDECNDLTYNQPVFKVSAIDSHVWFHRGWRLELDNCLLHHDNASVFKYTQYEEDITHGAMDLWFVRACYESNFSNCELCPPYFTFAEMVRFRNTLTKNIYYSDFTGGHFHNNVDGSDNGFADNTCSPSCPSDLMYGEVLDWIPLYKFDEGPLPNVYDIILSHTVGLASTPSTSELTGAESYLGLSEVVKAQWDRECVDLNMTNRDLIYDQDFFAKGNLYIQPTIAATTPVKAFAEPNNSTPGPDYFNKNEYIVESGIKSHMKAGNGIHLYAGFSAKAGCDFRAYIDPTLCDGGTINDFRKTNVNENSLYASTQNLPPASFNQPKPAVNLEAYADHEKQMVNLQSKNITDKSQSLVITDLTGRIIQTFDHLPSSISTQNMTPSLYIFIYTTEQGRASQKLFIE